MPILVIHNKFLGLLMYANQKRPAVFRLVNESTGLDNGDIFDDKYSFRYTMNSKSLSPNESSKTVALDL